MIDLLYKEEILEHYKTPQNFGKLKEYNSSSKQTNPFCGDEIEMFVQFKNYSSSEANQSREGAVAIIQNISFTGQGCAISVAATSMLSEHVLGKNKKELTNFSELDMLGLLGIEVSESRKKCALLGLAVLKDCLNSC